MGECACAQVDIYLCACVAIVGGCRKYVICGFAPADTSALRGLAPSLSLQSWNRYLGGKR